MDNLSSSQGPMDPIDPLKYRRDQGSTKFPNFLDFGLELLQSEVGKTAKKSGFLTYLSILKKSYQSRAI